MNKKTVVGAGLALALSAGSAFGADLPHQKAPPYIPPPPPLLWTGFYVGLNAGYDFGGSNSVTVMTWPGFINPAFAPGVIAGAAALASSASGVLPSNDSGFIGGGQLGYNYQFSNSFVVGLEADIEGAGVGGAANTFNAQPVPAFGFALNSILTARKNLDYLGTVRGRLGWLATSTLLTYVTGGLAYGGVNSNVNITTNIIPALAVITPSLSSFSDTRVGWTVGGGFEWMFMPNWSAKLEYLYYDLGNVTFNGGGPIAIVGVAPPAIALTSFSTTSTRYNGHIVRAGLNYHFNWSAAPVVAKY